MYLVKNIQRRYKNNQNYFQGIALPGPRCPLYLFSEKDAAAIANSAMRQNKVRRFGLLTPFCRRAQEPAASGLPRCPHAALLVSPSARITAGTCFSQYKPACLLSRINQLSRKFSFFKKQS